MADQIISKYARKQIVKRGSLAFLNGMSLQDNPFRPDDIRHSEWEKGWKNAKQAA